MINGFFRAQAMQPTEALLWQGFRRHEARFRKIFVREEVGKNYGKIGKDYGN